MWDSASELARYGRNAPEADLRRLCCIHVPHLALLKKGLYNAETQRAQRKTPGFRRKIPSKRLFFPPRLCALALKWLFSGKPHLDINNGSIATMGRRRPHSRREAPEEPEFTRLVWAMSQI